jgi:23S rRNA (uracil1939-C5)-methyltransferase
VGFRQAQSHQLVDIDHCHIIYRTLSDRLPAIKHLLASLKRRSVVSEVSLCEDSDGQQGVMLACKQALHDSDLMLLKSYAAEHQLRIEVQWPESDVSQHWQTGLPQLYYRHAGSTISLPFTLTDFTQVNPLINQQLIDCARDWLQVSVGDTLADYFCGLGNFSLAMAAQLEAVYGYELSAAMVEKATAAAADNGSANSHFRVSNLMAADARINQSANKVLLDPPRAGAESLCRQLAVASADRIVYISCNTQTLLRDAQLLTAKNYRLEKIRLADMFPQTRHSEAIALFTRAQTR